MTSGTQAAAYGAFVAAGHDVAMQAYVLDLFRKHGPMADWRLYEVGVNDAFDRPTILARRNELSRADVLGTTNTTTINPRSKKPGEVRGILGEHAGVVLERPEDLLRVRRMGKCESFAMPYGQLHTLTNEEIGSHVRAMLHKLQGWKPAPSDHG